MSVRSLHRGFLPGLLRIRFVAREQQERGRPCTEVGSAQLSGTLACDSFPCQLCNLGKLLNCSGPPLNSKMRIRFSEELRCGLNESVGMLSTVLPVSGWSVASPPLLQGATKRGRAMGDPRADTQEPTRASGLIVTCQSAPVCLGEGQKHVCFHIWKAELTMSTSQESPRDWNQITRKSQAHSKALVNAGLLPFASELEVASRGGSIRQGRHLECLPELWGVGGLRGGKFYVHLAQREGNGSALSEGRCHGKPPKRRTVS